MTGFGWRKVRGLPLLPAFFIVFEWIIKSVQFEPTPFEASFVRA